MTVYVCVSCAVADCGNCRGNVTRGGSTRRCSCRHQGDRLVATADPRQAGGAILTVHSGRSGVLLDTRRAVHVDNAEVCEVENPSDGRALMALFLEGKLNLAPGRAAILHLLEAHTAAAVVGQLVGLAARMGPAFEAEFRGALDAELAADLWPVALSGGADG